MRAQAWEHELQLDEAQRYACEAEPPDPQPDDHDAMHPSEETMKPWLVPAGKLLDDRMEEARGG